MKYILLNLRPSIFTANPYPRIFNNLQDAADYIKIHGQGGNKLFRLEEVTVNHAVTIE